MVLKNWFYERSVLSPWVCSFKTHLHLRDWQKIAADEEKPNLPLPFSRLVNCFGVCLHFEALTLPAMPSIFCLDVMILMIPPLPSCIICWWWGYRFYFLILISWRLLITFYIVAKHTRWLPLISITFWEPLNETLPCKSTVSMGTS